MRECRSGRTPTGSAAPVVAFHPDVAFVRMRSGAGVRYRACCCIRRLGLRRDHVGRSGPRLRQLARHQRPARQRSRRRREHSQAEGGLVAQRSTPTGQPRRGLHTHAMRRRLRRRLHAILGGSNIQTIGSATLVYGRNITAARAITASRRRNPVRRLPRAQQRPSGWIPDVHRREQMRTTEVRCC